MTPSPKNRCLTGTPAAASRRELPSCRPCAPARATPGPRQPRHPALAGGARPARSNSRCQSSSIERNIPTPFASAGNPSYAAAGGISARPPSRYSSSLGYTNPAPSLAASAAPCLTRRDRQLRLPAVGRRMFLTRENRVSPTGTTETLRTRRYSSDSSRTLFSSTWPSLMPAHRTIWRSPNAHPCPGAEPGQDRRRVAVVEEGAATSVGGVHRHVQRREALEPDALPVSFGEVGQGEEVAPQERVAVVVVVDVQRSSQPLGRPRMKQNSQWLLQVRMPPGTGRPA